MSNMSRQELLDCCGEMEDLLDDLKDALDADDVATAKQLLNEWFADEEGEEEHNEPEE